MVLSLRNVVHFAVIVATAGSQDPARDGPDWMLMPDGSGEVRLAMLSPLPAIPQPSPDVQFVLYTRGGPVSGERGSLGPDCSSLQFANFSPKRPSKVLVHGFGDGVEASFMVPVVRDAFLGKGDFNVFAVDWSLLAQAPWYNSAANNTFLAAEMTARLVDDLEQTTGASASDFHLVGFSLGAHVVGLAGRMLAERRPGDDGAKVHRITGLDPAQVLFTAAEAHQRIDPSDATFVEVVHTSGGYLGFMRPLGHVDVYPNGGAWPQPGCVLDFVAVCSHRRAYYIYSEAILSDGKGFEARPCRSWQQLEVGDCKGDVYALGAEHVDDSSRGVFFLDTNEEEPFAKKNSDPEVNFGWW